MDYVHAAGAGCWGFVGLCILELTAWLEKNLTTVN